MEKNYHSMTMAVLRWFRENGRELPWRETRDPYAIWLSEIILQQTRIVQGWSYWERFMKRWPTVEALAAASEDDVLREWQGLGYYSRARNLHTAARQIVSLGHFPDTLEEIKQLKGVGDYTAAAIGSIAFGLPAAVVDGNVYRVLSRYFGITTPINTTEGKKVFTALAQDLLPKDRPSEFNQAMMDFGAMQCTPRQQQNRTPAKSSGEEASSPLSSCGTCPLMESCVAFREDKVGELPVKLKKTVVKTQRLTYLYIRCGGMIAIHRRGEGDIWQGLYEPYLLPEGDDVPRDAQLRLWKTGERLFRHVLTHRILLADFYLWEPAECPSLPSDYFWIKESDISQYAIPRLIEILLGSLPEQL
jgi:A/G-specific adenine glycosylase